MDFFKTKLKEILLGSTLNKDKFNEALQILEYF